MKMTSTDALMHKVKTRPRSAAFIFHARRGLPRSPTVSLRIALSKGDRNVLQAIAAATDKANRQHFGAAPVQPIEPSARARWPEMEPSTQGRV
jgi:hypothetical protein